MPAFKRTMPALMSRRLVTLWMAFAAASLGAQTNFISGDVTNRHYSLFASTNLAGTNSFVAVSGQTNRPGTGGPMSLSDTNVGDKFLRVRANLP
jgi:hypothetical protein